MAALGPHGSFILQGPAAEILADSSGPTRLAEVLFSAVLLVLA